MADSWTELREVHQRIRWARLHTDLYPRPIDGARSLSIRPGTYRTYEQKKENDGRVPPLTVIQKIAKKYGVSWVWLASGDGTPFDKDETTLKVVTDQIVARIGNIPADKRDDALAAVQGVLDAYARKAS